MAVHLFRWARWLAVVAVLVAWSALNPRGQSSATAQPYEHADTRDLVALVTDASALVAAKGEAAFDEFGAAGSRWRHGDSYIFVIDSNGTTVVHPDPAMQGRTQLDLTDVNGKPIIRGLLGVVSDAKPEGWYHYEWPVPGGLLPRWKSTYARLVTAPSGKRYVVASGVYNDRMERAFVVDAVNGAVALLEAKGVDAFPLLHDPTGPFIAKDAYVFVVDRKGTDLVNPGFPNLEGRNILDVKDTQGKALIREMLSVTDAHGEGWVDYMWPKPGDAVSTLKSAYVRRATIGEESVIVGCGVYLADAPRGTAAKPAMTASELTAFVRDAAALAEKQGEQAYSAFRERGSKWFRDDTYVFVWTLDGTRVFNAANPTGEGEEVSGIKDVLGRPFGQMIVAVGRSASGEGWIHYMHPEPGTLFPIWKSSYLKRVTFPSGQQYLVGSGVYNMQMDKSFIEDLVDRASALVAERGRDAFPLLRDKAGPFVFMDAYVFVESPGGMELMNAGHPGIEGKSLAGVRDVKGKLLVDDYIAAAMKNGSAWEEYVWYRPGSNTPARKLAYVRKVQHGTETFIVGSGLYVD